MDVEGTAAAELILLTLNCLIGVKETDEGSPISLQTLEPGTSKNVPLQYPDLRS
jgi:hypothetical protein